MYLYWHFCFTRFYKYLSHLPFCNFPDELFIFIGYLVCFFNICASKKLSFEYNDLSNPQVQRLRTIIDFNARFEAEILATCSLVLVTTLEAGRSYSPSKYMFRGVGCQPSCVYFRYLPWESFRQSEICQIDITSQIDINIWIITNLHYQAKVRNRIDTYKSTELENGAFRHPVFHSVLWETGYAWSVVVCLLKLAALTLVIWDMQMVWLCLQLHFCRPKNHDTEGALLSKV